MMTWVNLPATYLLSLLVFTVGLHFFGTTFADILMADLGSIAWRGEKLLESAYRAYGV